MDTESAAIYQSIFEQVSAFRDGRRLRSYTTLAYADVVDSHGNSLIVGSMNGAGGLTARQFRGTQGVTYFSVNSSAKDPSIVSLARNGTIQRAQNRHAEMNIVMFAMSQHIAANRPPNTFVLDCYLSALNPSQKFCPECQLAIALLSASGARLISSISEHVMVGGSSALVIRSLSDLMLSPNWAPPWTSYYNDIPGADYFRDASGAFRNGRGPFAIKWEGGDVAICRLDVDGRWQVAQRVGVHHG